MGDRTSGSICGAESACNITISLPLGAAFNSWTGTNGILVTACMRLDPLANSEFQLQASTIGVALQCAADGIVNCTGTKLGRYLAVQYVVPLPAASPSPSPAQSGSGSPESPAPKPSPSASPPPANLTYSTRPLAAAELGKTLAYSFR